MHSQQKRRYTQAYCIQNFSVYPHARLSKRFCGLYKIQMAPLFNKWNQAEPRHGALEECTTRPKFGAATAFHESCGGVFLVWLGSCCWKLFSYWVLLQVVGRISAGSWHIQGPAPQTEFSVSSSLHAEYMPTTTNEYGSTVVHLLTKNWIRSWALCDTRGCSNMCCHV